MTKKKADITIPDETVISKIFIIRGKRVMIDTDLAELYGVPTKRLNEQVKRNTKWFPEDFMFQLSEEKRQSLIENYKHLNRLKYSPNLPFAFTEHGAVMLASVLNSESAIEVNVQIVRIFTRMREMLLTHKDILLKLETLERKAVQHDGDIKLIFKYLKELLNPPTELVRKIGFKHKNED
ncbi:MAG: ORF6N domain-containing protein [Bacteroidota bacterium]